NNAVNGDAPSFNGDSVTITTDKGDEHNSVFYNERQPITGFTATFTYQVGGARAADGVTFCIQNDPSGPKTVGTEDGGSALGYQGIQPSAAVAFNIYSVQNPNSANGHFGETDFLYADTLGNRKDPGGTYLDTTPVELTSNGPIHVTLI